jgi:hypothetical protein
MVGNEEVDKWGSVYEDNFGLPIDARQNPMTDCPIFTTFVQTRTEKSLRRR